MRTSCQTVIFSKPTVLTRVLELLKVPISGHEGPKGSPGYFFGTVLPLRSLLERGPECKRNRSRFWKIDNFPAPESGPSPHAAGRLGRTDARGAESRVGDPPGRVKRNAALRASGLTPSPRDSWFSLPRGPLGSVCPAGCGPICPERRPFVGIDLAVLVLVVLLKDRGLPFVPPGLQRLVGRQLFVAVEDAVLVGIVLVKERFSPGLRQRRLHLQNNNDDMDCRRV